MKTVKMKRGMDNDVEHREWLHRKRRKSARFTCVSFFMTLSAANIKCAEVIEASCEEDALRQHLRNQDFDEDDINITIKEYANEIEGGILREDHDGNYTIVARLKEGRK